ncbi:unnamed protein product [Dovyalis caffra]|uniref:Uncharacterized protein n=1 Tax=Dovyalis caffra TaxID=77055 RepID=A0AAV1R7X9_9ROSI|nr:unnamed protein product [Dovyalis caffra]
MTSAIIKDATQLKEASKLGLVAVAEEEGEEELFEIDFEVIDSLPPPQYNWENYFTASGSALLANCLLPIADLSTASTVLFGARSVKGQGLLVLRLYETLRTYGWDGVIENYGDQRRGTRFSSKNTTCDHSLAIKKLFLSRIK